VTKCHEEEQLHNDVVHILIHVKLLGSRQSLLKLPRGGEQEREGESRNKYIKEGSFNKLMNCTVLWFWAFGIHFRMASSWPKNSSKKVYNCFGLGL
jgi:hypothetical protein